jgi:putative membrane protein
MIPVGYLWLLVYALLGVLMGSALSLLPSLHVYNVMGFVILAYAPLAGIFSPLQLIMLLIGMLVGYAFLFNAQTILLNVPDDSTMFILLPGSKYLQQGRGYEAVMLTGLGCLIGVFFVVIALPLGMFVLAKLRMLLAKHIFWIIGGIIAFILLSEWPKDFGRVPSRWGRLKEGWASVSAGYLTFFLSSILGFIVFYRTIIPVKHAFLQLALPFIGLFAVPALLLNIIAEVEVPRQHITKSVDVSGEEVSRGALAGCLGGLLGAFVPAVTAGVAGLVAGHATAQKGDKPFVISLGAARVVYYVGAVMLFFLPLLHLRRGWLAININLFFVPETTEHFLLVASAVALSGCVAFLLLLCFARVMIKIITRFSYRKISIVVLGIVFCIVIIIGGWKGLLVTLVASAIGLIPLMFHSRRLNCLAVLLVPIWLNMAGVGDEVAALLGLL